MQIDLMRNVFTSNSTVGEMSINGQFQCYTLEDPVRPVKIAGMTAIRAGSYEVLVSYSARFQRPLP